MLNSIVGLFGRIVVMFGVMLKKLVLVVVLSGVLSLLCGIEKGLCFVGIMFWRLVVKNGWLWLFLLIW